MIGTLLVGYVGMGVLFGVWFLVAGHAKVDPASAAAAWYTRLLWLPGAILLWPILTAKAFRTGNEESS